MRTSFIRMTLFYKFIKAQTFASRIMKLLTSFQLSIKKHMDSSSLKPQWQINRREQLLEEISLQEDFWLDMANSF